MSWVTPTHLTSGLLPSATFNRDLDNLTFLHDGFGLCLHGPFDDVSTTVHAIDEGCYLVPAYSKDALTVTKIAYRSDTANGNVDVGIYIDTGNQSCEKVATSDLTVMPAGSGPRSVNLENPAVIEPFKRYWLVIGFDSANARVRGTNGPLALKGRKAVTTPEVPVMPLPTLINFVGGPDESPCLAGLP